MMRRRTASALVVLALAAFGTACGDSSREEGPPSAADLNSAEVTQEYAPSLDIDLSRMERAPSGLHREDVVIGDGAVAEPGDTVVVHYTGWLANGEQFDSSRPAGNPFQVVIGTGEVIDGWDQGIPGMRVGGTRRLVIPPALAYGAEGAGMGVIPPGATLVFEVELLDVRP
ncbi:MAG TPA: FKBP-type peptidyl-prolyl cis-trans isomerase [Longimicrobiales bacterium]|nr:FKBP-type peptidyl-prolyl cis-trans isomerase [Longimicrobiales bacterium]